MGYKLLGMAVWKGGKLYLTQKGEWKRSPAAPAELASIPGLREALFALCSLPPAAYTEPQWEALEAILEPEEAEAVRLAKVL